MSRVQPPRSPHSGKFDHPHFKSEVSYLTTRLLRAFGLDPTDPRIKDTPDRVARKWLELLEGYTQDAQAILARQFPGDGYDQMVVLEGIEFVSTCEHHLLPFIGKATVGYLPGEDGRVVGLSKLARVVECYARRLQVQERMTTEIADALETAISPRGVGVMVRATHQCMVCRGVRKPQAVMTTSVLRGVMRDDVRARSEFLDLARG